MSGSGTRAGYGLTHRMVSRPESLYIAAVRAVVRFCRQVHVGQLHGDRESLQRAFRQFLTGWLARDPPQREAGGD
jgi:hypothetical protein